MYPTGVPHADCIGPGPQPIDMLADGCDPQYVQLLPALLCLLQLLVRILPELSGHEVFGKRQIHLRWATLNRDTHHKRQTMFQRTQALYPAGTQQVIMT